MLTGPGNLWTSGTHGFGRPDGPEYGFAFEAWGAGGGGREKKGDGLVGADAIAG